MQICIDMLRYPEKDFMKMCSISRVEFNDFRSNEWIHTVNVNVQGEIYFKNIYRRDQYLHNM